MKYLFEWIIEFTLMFLHFPLGVLNFFLPFEPVATADGRTPIILVERWIKRNPLHFFMKNYLEKKGFTVYSVNFPLLHGSFSESARALKNYIEDKKLTNVILIGISNGGLTCYQYLTDYHGWGKTKLFIGIGTPFRGARLGFFLSTTVAKKELAPHGAYIASVLSKPLRHKEKIYCIGAKYDQMVGHTNSFLPGANKIIIDVAGHNLLHTIWLPTLRKIGTICLANE